MRGKITHVSFSESRVVETPALYQYDYGQVLMFDNLKLPDNYEVIFSNSTALEGKTVIGTSEGVLIPDEYLETGKNVMVWIFLHEEDTDGEVEYVVRIPVRPRSKATDEEPTPVEQSEITQAIAALNAGVGHVDETAEEIEKKLYMLNYIQEILDRLSTLEKSGTIVYEGNGMTLKPKSTIDDEIAFTEFAVHAKDFLGIVFSLALPSGKTAEDYPGSYVTLADVDGAVDTTEHHMLTESRHRMDGNYEFTIPLSSLCFADLITPTFHYTENGVAKEVVGKGSTIEEYLGWAFNNISVDNYKLAQALLDYGYYAIKYLPGGPNYTPVTNRVTESYDYDEFIAKVAKYAPEKVTSDIVPNIGTQMQFGGWFTFNTSFVFASSSVIEPIYLDGVEAEVRSGGSRQRIVSIANIPATDMTKVHMIETSDAHIKMAPIGYTYTALTSDTASEDAKNFACATINYIEACGVEL